MDFGDSVDVIGANPKATIMVGDGGRICIQNPDTKVIIMVQCDTDHVVDVSDESGRVIETHNLASQEEAQSSINSLIVKYSWLC